MDWNAAWQTALALIASVGGAGIIIASVVKWSADRIAEQIIKKKEFEFSQRIEELKSNLEKKNYISKVRFDLEIEVYKNLSGLVLEMVNIFKNIEANDLDIKQSEQIRNYKKNKIDDAIKSRVNARAEIMRNAPFIPSRLYDLFMTIEDTCRKQLMLPVILPLGYSETDSFETDLSEFNQRKEYLESAPEIVIKQIREQIASLDVLDK